jgi:hypothetical protein
MYGPGVTGHVAIIFSTETAGGTGKEELVVDGTITEYPKEFPAES